MFGADVISRISAAQKNSENAVQLVTVLREAVRDMIIILLGQTDRQTKELLKVMLAGNSVITHFFLKLETVQLGRIPFSTIIHEAQIIKLADGGIPELQVFANAVLTTIPLISGFLGGDAVAAGIAAGLHCSNSDGGTILYDFGTNCEILLEVKGAIYGASAAAGPAFEGYNISSGMRYAVGAVSKVTEDHGTISFDVIGGGCAKGFCGSALLDLLAIMISAGHVDRKGNLKCNIEYQGENNHYKYYAAADAEGAGRKILFTDKQNQQTLTLTLQDIRNLQLAKGAISAAVAILLKVAGITESELGTVKIAGVFGNGLQTGAAKALGVLAGTAETQVGFVKDAALLGVSMCMLHEDIFDEAKLFARRVNSIDLIEDTDFLATYLRCLQF